MRKFFQGCKFHFDFNFSWFFQFLIFFLIVGFFERNLDKILQIWSVN